MHHIPPPNVAVTTAQKPCSSQEHWPSIAGSWTESDLNKGLISYRSGIQENSFRLSWPFPHGAKVASPAPAITLTFPGGRQGLGRGMCSRNPSIGFAQFRWVTWQLLTVEKAGTVNQRLVVSGT